MEIKYGEVLKLKSDVPIRFVCSAVHPIGHNGYREKHYSIDFGESKLILGESVIDQMFEPYKPEKEPEETINFSKLKKDELLNMAKELLPDRDVSTMRKDELITLLEVAS